MNETKAEDFLKELKYLCIAHKVQLSSANHDTLQIWNLSKNEVELYFAGIEDCTDLK